MYSRCKHESIHTRASRWMQVHTSDLIVSERAINAYIGRGDGLAGRASDRSIQHPSCQASGPRGCLDSPLDPKFGGATFTISDTFGLVVQAAARVVSETLRNRLSTGECTTVDKGTVLAVDRPSTTRMRLHGVQISNHSAHPGMPSATDFPSM